MEHTEGRKKLVVLKDTASVSHRNELWAKFSILAVLVIVIPCLAWYLSGLTKESNLAGVSNGKLEKDYTTWGKFQTPISSWRDNIYYINGSSSDVSLLDDKNLIGVFLIFFCGNIQRYFQMARVMVSLLLQHLLFIVSRLIKKFGHKKLICFLVISTLLCTSYITGLVCSVELILTKLGTSIFNCMESMIYDSNDELPELVTARQTHPSTMGKSAPFFLYKYYRFPLEDVVFKCEYQTTDPKPFRRSANWRKNGLPLQINDSRIQIKITISKVDNLELYNVLSVLTIQLLEESDFAHYTCEYHNPYNSFVQPGPTMSEGFHRSPHLKPIPSNPKCNCQPKPPTSNKCRQPVYVEIYECFSEFALVRQKEKVVTKFLTPGSLFIETVPYKTIEDNVNIEIDTYGKEILSPEENCCSTFLMMYWRLFRGGGYFSARPPFTRTILTDEGLLFQRYQCLCKHSFGMREFKIFRSFVNATDGRRDSSKIIFPVKHKLFPVYFFLWQSPSHDNESVTDDDTNCFDSNFSNTNCRTMERLLESSMEFYFFFENLFLFVMVIIFSFILERVPYIVRKKIIRPILNAVLYFKQDDIQFESVAGKPLKNLQSSVKLQTDDISTYENCKDYDIYISYDEEVEYDLMIAEHIKGILMSMNLSIFDAHKDVPLGHPAFTEIEKAIAHSSRFVVITSQSYVEHKVLEFNAVQTTIIGKGFKLKDRLLIIKSEDCDIDRLYLVPCIRLTDYLKKRDALDEKVIDTFLKWETITRPLVVENSSFGVDNILELLRTPKILNAVIIALSFIIIIVARLVYLDL
ncbi:hypothetical protein BgiBS90_005127 [Biomphalaria glabrata]|nr:hypothetical protein BgiBS90_005127 [Biomphalaria glabrata]